MNKAETIKFLKNEIKKQNNKIDKLIITKGKEYKYFKEADKVRKNFVSKLGKALA